MNNSSRVLILFIALAVIALALTLQSFGQGKEQNSSTNKAVEAPINRGIDSKPGAQQPAPPEATPDFSKATWDLPADADKTVNPVAATPESVAKGKELYLTQKGNCVFCHGESGGGNEENLSKLRRKPADLSDKRRMSTMSDGELFWKITRGIPGIMPSKEKKMTEEERWQAVNYIRTLGKELPEN
jgi:mono/diheme cytochrome c family protein